MKNSNKAAIEAEGAMQTRYGSTKEEMQMLTDAYAGKISEYQKIISLLRETSIPKSNVVDLGSVVGCLIDDIKNWYLIVPVGGGEDIEMDELTKITSISFKSPLAQDLIGRKVGDSFEIRNKKYKIENVL